MRQKTKSCFSEPTETLEIISEFSSVFDAFLTLGGCKSFSTGDMITFKVFKSLP
eukprot:UN18367